MRNKEARPLLTAFILIFIFSVFALLPEYIKYRNTPKESYYSFLHNSVSDYPFYTSLIRQGIEGNLLSYNSFTTEKQTLGLIHGLYLYSGLVGSVFFKDAVLIYLTLRIILGFIYAFIAYFFISFFIKENKWRLTGLFFFLTAASFPILGFEDKIQISSYMQWWTESEPLRRMFFVPHIVAGHAGMAVIFLFFTKVFYKLSLFRLIVLVTAGLLTGFIYPPNMVFSYMVIIFSVLALTFFHPGPMSNKLKYLFYTSGIFLIFLILTAFPLIYSHILTARVFPWSLAGFQEKLFYAISLREYILSFGFLFILALGGIAVGFRRSTANRKFLVILFLWILLDLIFLPLSKELGTDARFSHFPMLSNIRFLSMGLYLPLSVFAVIFVRRIAGFFRRASLLMMALYVIVNFSVYPSQFISQTQDFINLTALIYPDRNFVKVLREISSESQGNNNILTDEWTGHIIPVYSANKVFTGQPVYTKNYRDKNILAGDFIQGKMDECAAARLVSRHDIIYVYATDETKDLTLTYSFFEIYSGDSLYPGRFYKILPINFKDIRDCIS